ncbi:exostosin domain-containing protein [Pustulibacterium marinum]|uniref:exostosin domain-containing protein n=1 Tax=Pustulibacterium marinum TaxID=1224947 RepID=UPI0015A50ED8|nr:exostosin family protein [Pustulibacterium marinum]
MEDAQVLIVPISIDIFFKSKKKKELYKFIDKANSLNKSVWIYSSDDRGITIDKNVLTFRFGGFKSKTSINNTVMLPVFIEDPLDILKIDFYPLKKNEHPLIGFVGHADKSIKKIWKEQLIHLYNCTKILLKKEHFDHQKYFPSAVIRYNLLKELESSSSIHTNFIYRGQYRAGAKSDGEKQRTTLEFYQNIFDCPYTFCIRGAGNFSVRLYETLALGRIPVLIDTDCRLPLENEIDWKKHSLITTQENLIEDFVVFHNSLSNKEFEAIQISNRKLWNTHFRRDAFFMKIYEQQKNNFE